MLVNEPHAQEWGDFVEQTNAFCRSRQVVTSVVLLSRSIEDTGISEKEQRAAVAPRLRVGFTGEQVRSIGNNRIDVK